MKSCLLALILSAFLAHPVAAATIPDSCLNTVDTLSVWYIDVPRLALISNTLTSPDDPENIRQIIVDDQVMLVSEYGTDKVRAEVLGIVCRVENRGGGLRQVFYFDVQHGTPQDFLQSVTSDLMEDRHYTRISWRHAKAADDHNQKR